MQQSAGKVLASVFWDAHGIIFIDCFEKGRKIIARRIMSEVILLNFRSKLAHMDKLEVIWYHCNYLLCIKCSKVN